ncbi:hypothetical protein CONPUDRAFT_157963 [Coniophora puteana RWD-64-598 SS2]|uniref:Uncharacterized protein n=1 Tax=Coniophora puteana (strain RWD-64-598) TaxID=741705 RepID=A0A5M3MDX1_CONPW|nr:uncharacterized protein CONPUDRAFT_157963 [Coniophora puteana RWD-64-598 SS2]EIW76805.1 hypothetical protein CONPUDRAFT_157963 [Coniophora puteana RWD-64-598 SS2]
MLPILGAVASAVTLATAFPALDVRQLPAPITANSSVSCLSLRNGCNATVIDPNNAWNYTDCALLAICSEGVSTPQQTLNSVNLPTTQPRLTEDVFNQMTGGADRLTQQNYVDAYNAAIASTPAFIRTYVLQGQYETIAAWTGDCDDSGIPYSNFADWFDYSGTAGVCPAVQSCNATLAASADPCVPQPITDNGSCNGVAGQCALFIQQDVDGLFQNSLCLMASMCYAESTTDVLINKMFPSYVSNIPTTADQTRLSLDLFHNVTGGNNVMTLQNAIDAYYGALTNTYDSLGGPWGAQDPQRSGNNGPYPTSTDYVSNFWSIISAWTGLCDTQEIPYDNLADYLSYAASSGYHPTC